MSPVHPDGAPQRLPSILIVDGDDDTRLLYRTILEPVADSILEADDGASALAAAVERQPDLVITETRLRRLDGYTLCERLRDDPHTNASLRLVVTGSAQASDLVHARASGADQLLIKPCTPEDLRSTVVQMWSHRPPAGAEAR
jgi:putative two-component system response regulator